MDFFKFHPVLLKLPEGKEAVKKYNRLGRILVQYELTYYDFWRRQSVRHIHSSWDFLNEIYIFVPNGS